MKKRVLSILLCVCMVLSLLQCSTVTVSAASSYFSGGDGTMENPYKITQSNQLQYMADVYSAENGANSYYALQNDINMNGAGTGIESFSGVFNGNGHTISNLNGRLVYSNSGTIRNVVLSNPVCSQLRTSANDDFGTNYGREILSYDDAGNPIFSKLGTLKQPVTYYLYEYFGFAVGHNLSGGTVDNVTVTNGTIKAFYEAGQQTVTTQDEFWKGMVRYAPGYIGGVVGYNAGTISNCTTQNLTVNADSALGICGGIAGFNSNKIIGSVTSGMTVKKTGTTGNWTNTENREAIYTWAVGGIAGRSTGMTIKSDHTENTEAKAKDDTQTEAGFPAIGFFRTDYRKDVTENTTFDVAAWNARVDAGIYPGLKKRDTSNYLKVVETAEVPNQVEIRYYDNNGVLLNRENMAINSSFTLPLHTELVYDVKIDGKYKAFVDKYVVTKASDGTVLTATKPGDNIVMSNSINVKWNMPLTPYMNYDITTQQGSSFPLNFSLINDGEKLPSIGDIYTEEEVTALKNSITVKYTKDGETSSSVADGVYGNYEVTLDTAGMSYPNMLKNSNAKAQLWYIGPLTSSQIPISNTLNGYTGSPVIANLPVLQDSGVSYEVWYKGTGGTTYGASMTAPIEVGNYTVSIKNVGECLNGTDYAKCWLATAGPIVLGTMTISSSGLTVFTNNSSTPSTDTKFAVSYLSGGEKKSMSFAEGSSSIAIGSIPTDATDVALTYDGFVVKNITDFNPAKAYKFDLAKLTVYNAADGNQKGDTSISDIGSISSYDGILQFWVEKGKTLGDVLTKAPVFDGLSFSCWVDSENPTATYPDNTSINSAMAVAAKYTDPNDHSGFEVGGLYYFFDEDFGFSAVNMDKYDTILHYLGYYGGTVRSKVGSVNAEGNYIPAASAQVRRIFMTPDGMFKPSATSLNGILGNWYNGYLLSGVGVTSGTQRLPSNNYEAQNGYPDGNGVWRVNPWNDRTQLFVNLGSDKAGVPSGIKELGIYRDKTGFSYSGDNNVVGLQSNYYFDSERFRMLRLVYDMKMELTQDDYWDINLHLIDGAQWNFGKKYSTSGTVSDREIHYIATNGNTQSLLAPSSGVEAGQITLDNTKLTSIRWKDENGKYYLPGDMVPRGITDLYMVNADNLLSTLDAQGCIEAGLDSSYIGYYPIRTEYDLTFLRDVINAMGDWEVKKINVVFLNDLDMSIESDWCPIGYRQYPNNKVYYSGTFDGRGHSISNLNSTRGGLFNYTYDITIKDLTIASGNINTNTSQNNSLGAFLDGVLDGGGRLIGCVNYANVSGEISVGGLIGEAGAKVPITFERCCNFGNVIASSSFEKHSGSIFGSMSGNSTYHQPITVTDCYAKGRLYGGQWGNVGATTTITNSYFTDAGAGGTAFAEDQLTSGQLAWRLNTNDGAVANKGLWSQGEANAIFANSSDKLPAYRVTFSGDSFTTVYGFTNAQGTILAMPDSVSGKLLTYDTDKAFTASTKVNSDLTVTVTDAGGNVTAAPTFADSGSTYIMQGSAPKSAKFALSTEPTINTVYYIYSAITEGKLIGTVAQSGTTLTVTLYSAPTADSTDYYIAAQEENKAESSRIKVTCMLKTEPVFNSDISNVTATYGDGQITWNNSLKTGDGVVSFQSSNTDVVSVDANGTLTIRKVGTSTIKVSVAEGANNKAKIFTYTVTVNPKDVTETKAATDQTAVNGVGSFTEPTFGLVTGALTYGWNLETGKTYTEAVAYLKTLDKDSTATLSYSYAASGNYTGTITGTIAVKVINVEFTGDGLTVTIAPIYGKQWNDIIQLDSSKYLAKLNSENIDGNYRVQVKTGMGEYTDINSTTIPMAGNYSYQVLFDSTDNKFNDNVVKTGTLTVAQRVVELTWSNTSLTYNGNIQAPTAAISNKVGNDVVTVTIIGGQTNVGSGYTATADTLDGAAKNNYKLPDVKPTQSFSITHATTNLLWGNAKQTVTYTGNEAVITAPTVTHINNEPYNGEITYSYKAEGSTGDYISGLPVNAGTWVIKAHMTASGNYAAADSADMVLTITPAPLTIKSVTAEDRVYVKDDTSVTITEVTFDGGNVTEGSDYTVSGSMANDNAGKNKAVTVTVTMTNNNYALSSSTTVTTVNISKANAITIPEKSVSHRYNISGEQTIKVNDMMPDDAGTLTYSKGTESGTTTIVSTWSVEADGTIKYTLAGGSMGNSITLPVIIKSDNYSESTVKVVITLAGKDSQTTPEDFTLKFTLNDDETTYTATIPAVDGAEYSFDGNDWSSDNTKSNVKPNDSVTGYIRMKATEEKNASAATSNTKTAPSIVETPIAFPNGGMFSGSQTVTLNCLTDGASIYYNINGAMPTINSTLYEHPFTITETTTVTAIAVKTGMHNSEVLNVTFTKYLGGNLEVTQFGWIYGETPSEPSYIIPEGAGAVSTTYSGITASGVEYLSNTTKPTQAGEYTFTVHCKSETVEYNGIAYFTISPKILTVTGVKATNRTYDGTNKVTLTGGILNGVVGNDDVSCSFTEGTMENPDIGNNKAVKVTKPVLTGADASNYILGNLSDITVNIEPVPSSGGDTPSSGGGNTTDNTTTDSTTTDNPIINFPFTDVAENDWYYNSVVYAYNNGLFAGTSDTTFSPNASMTRQMIWMVLARMDGKMPANMDGKMPANMDEARTWAMENNISDGTNPTNTITREQMASILYRYAQYKGYDITQGGMAIREFADYDNISEYALNALGWTVNTGLMQGSDNNLMPSGSATRAQVAAILQRFCQSVAK